MHHRNMRGVPRPSFASLFALLCASALAACMTPAAAQTQYRILVGYPPGGAQNALARVLADKLGEAIGRPFVVENRTGAAGVIAAEALKNAAPDGATLLMSVDSNMSVYPHTTKKPAYNPPSDFVAIAHTGGYNLALAVGPSVAAPDLKAFAASTRAHSSPTGYGTAGAGTSLHFYGVLLAQAAGANLTHVPYRGTGPALVDLAGGHVAAVVAPLGSFAQLARAGKVRVLGQSGSTRSASMPDVPTFKELGFPMLEIAGWFGVFAPIATRPEIVARYNEVIVNHMRTAEMRQLMQKFELDIRDMSPQEFQSMVKADYERWAHIIRSSGFTASSD